MESTIDELRICVIIYRPIRPGTNIVYCVYCTWDRPTAVGLTSMRCVAVASFMRTQAVNTPQYIFISTINECGYSVIIISVF